MNIIHSVDGIMVIPPQFAVPPMGTMFIFDQSELPLVERILIGFIDMYEEEDKDQFYWTLKRILETVQSHDPAKFN